MNTNRRFNDRREQNLVVKYYLNDVGRRDLHNFDNERRRRAVNEFIKHMNGEGE